MNEEKLPLITLHRFLDTLWNPETVPTGDGQKRIRTEKGRESFFDYVEKTLSQRECFHTFEVWDALCREWAQETPGPCMACLGRGEILFFYERPGSLPGNQMAPCPTCRPHA